MAILRDHGGRDDFRPDRHRGTICMHAADKLIRRSQAVGSLVGNVDSLEQHYYVTGASAPCLSPFFPAFSSGTLTPAGYLEGGAEYNEQAYWWQCEKQHRRALRHFPAALNDIRPRIASYELEMLQALEGMNSTFNQTAADKYFSRARNMVSDCGASLDAMPETSTGWLYNRYWQGYSKLNGA